MVNGVRRWQSMAEMSMSDNKGNEITFERDGTVSAGVTTMCDRCNQYAPSKNGQDIMASKGEYRLFVQIFFHLFKF